MIVRDNSRLVLNPDDNPALGFACELKKLYPDVFIDVISMAPESVIDLARDILRINTDRFLLLSDSAFAGSDTFATSTVLAKCLSLRHYDVILSGTHSIDGDTAHVPSQIAEALHIGQISNILSVHELDFEKLYAIVETEHDNTLSKYKIRLPAILSFDRNSKYKSPFVRFSDIDLFVDDRIKRQTGAELGLSAEQTGLKGSLTVVKETYSIFGVEREPVFVSTDDEGIETVYRFLEEKGFVNGEDADLL